MSLSFIRVRGAREHNLKNVDVDIPRDQLVVITGLSGSGKSSLAFDTIYAEGQRRYVESLSAYARQFLELTTKPDVDLIEGLSPAISIEQKTTSKNPRSTVGTVTEIYDYLRLLFARVGIPYSPATGLPIQSQTVSEMVDRIMAMASGTKLLILAPVVRGRKGEYKKELLDFRKRGFQRVRIDGTVYDIDGAPDLNKNTKHTLDVVVDRLVVKEGIETRLAETLETALKLSDGLVIAQEADSDRFTLFSERFSCPESGFTLSEIEPRLFSFNNPYGACPACDGLGALMTFDPELVVPDPTLSLRQGALAPWSNMAADYFWNIIESVADHYQVSTQVPFQDLPDAVRKVFLHGSGREKITFERRFSSGQSRQSVKTFEGVIPHLERRWKETDSSWIRDELAKYQTTHSCEACGGNRLKPEALCVKIQDKHIGQVTELSIGHSLRWFETIEDTLSPKHQDIAKPILKEIRERLTFLLSVGLDYLNLSRASGTLSGGESQRIRLASQIGSGLTGVIYVLDEPSIGLHQRDNNRLLDTLTRLRDLGNTVIVVEHDEDAIRMADYLIDMGPGAGIHGGQIVAQGTPTDVFQSPNSLTAQYLTGKKAIAIPQDRRTGNGKFLEIQGATLHSLQDVTTRIPLGTFTCVTGVSGSGKSSLIIETLYQALAKYLNGTRTIPGPHRAILGMEHLDKIVDIDQSPIGRTPRSNPATYTGIFTPIRDWFAGLPEAKSRGYGPGRFSFNVKGGRCEACQGDGVLKIEMHFLPDVYVECDQCKGKRYNRETLEIKYKGQSIADVLDMTVEEARVFFEAVSSIRDKCATLEQVGLGYIHLGQRATTLSGGEAQRVKLSKELSKRATGKTVYILDEPTTGLHFHDIAKLLEVLQTLVNQGNTVIVIEHNLDVIKTADWIIDLGPEGGTGGGRIIAEGTPEAVAKAKDSHTGHFLRAYLS